MIFYGYIVDVDTLERTVQHRIEAVCATEAYGKLEALREQWDDRLLLTDEKGKIICESDIDDDIGWLLDHYDKQHHVSLDDRLAKAVAQSDKEVIQMMRDFLKKHDPHFATDEYLDGLSLVELKEYYQGCRESVMESYRDAGDDWAQRRESLASENLVFHG